MPDTRYSSLSDLGQAGESPYERSLRRINEQIESLRTNISATQQTTQQTSRQLQSLIDALSGSMEKLGIEVGRVADNMTRYSSATAAGRRAVQDDAAQVKGLYDIYKSLHVELDSLTGAQAALEKSTREMTKVQQLYNEYLRAQDGSYDKLSAKYRIIKILYDNMSTTELERNAEIATSLRDIYEQMNLLQQATGKYQLQVGNYSKALTGLNIATNQVIRELPVLANGVSMFAIAISNNVPILADQIVKVRESAVAQRKLRDDYLATAAAAEIAGKAEEAAAARTAAASVKIVSVGKALVSAIVSWQTGLVLVLTALPGLIKKIQEKKKAQEEEEKQQKEVNDATKEGAKELTTLNQIYREIRSSIQGEITEVQVLKTILDDANRSWEDRVDAGKRLKQIFDEELEGFSAEEIAMGNAATKMQLLTEEIYNQAKARASLNKITELTQKLIELESDEELYGNWRVGSKTIREYVAEIDKANKEGRKVRIGAIEEEYVNKYRAVIADMKLYQGQINELVSQISPSNLLEQLRETGGGGGKDAAKNIGDFYYEMLQASAEAIPFELDRQLALLEVGWMKERDGYANQIEELTKMREGANEEEAELLNQQIEYLLRLLNMGQEKYNSEVQRILRERVDSYREAVEEEVGIAEDIPGMVEEAAKKSWSKRGRKYGGIMEAILAQTSEYGEANKFGQGVLKDEYVNFVTSVDSALKTSMGFMDDWMDKRLEMANVAVEAAEKEVAAAQKALDYELEARNNGYANSVETARKELDLQRANHQKALEEQRRIQNQQMILDSMSQTSSLITATANIWEAMTKGTGLLGPGLAIAATSLLWGSFIASKAKAAQLTKMQSEQYGEGTVELLEGGSHASGHDIDLGVKKDGTRRRAEGGEFFAVINKRSSRRYRGIIPDVINSFNDGTFGDKYYKANQAMGDFALGVLAGNSPTDVSKLERDVRAIREQGDEHRYVDSRGNTIIRYKNLTRKIKI